MRPSLKLPSLLPIKFCDKKLIKIDFKCFMYSLIILFKMIPLRKKKGEGWCAVKPV